MAEHLRIKLADADAVALVADRVTLQCYSSCARGLPASAEEWDISQLLIEGQPVQRETVVAYLNAISQHPNSEPMIDEEDNSPAYSHSFKGLAQLLAFADAVGSSRGLLLALDAQVSTADLVAEAQLGDTDIKLRSDSCFYFNKFVLAYLAPGSSTKLSSGAATTAVVSSNEQKAVIITEVSQQVEAMMHISWKLQLPKLQGLLKTFIRNNTRWPTSILSLDDARGLKTVLSARVIAAGAVPSCCAVDQALASCSSLELCSFTGSPSTGVRHLLKPMNLTAEQKQPLKFQAKAVEDFLHYRKGDKLDVEVDLFSSELKLKLAGSDALPIAQTAQLALGRASGWLAS